MSPKITDDFFLDDEPTTLWQEDFIKSQPFTPKTISQFAILQSSGWLIKNVIPRAELCMIYGPPGSGKTFAALDMGMAVSRNLSHWGDERVKGGRVVYICAEAPHGFKNRVIAYMQRHDIKAEELINFQVIDDVPNLLSINDHKSIASRIIKADLIFVDTLSSVISGGDENTGKDMNVLVSNCKSLAKATGATVVLIGHSGKNADNGHRGWSGMLGAVDAEIKVESLGTAHTLTVTKQKEGESGKQYGFFLKPEDLGEDQDGDPITSCVFEHSDVKVQHPEKQDKLGGVQKIIMDAIHITPERPIMIDDLLPRVIANMAQDPGKKDERRKRFFNSLETLQTKGILSIANNFLYIS